MGSTESPLSIDRFTILRRLGAGGMGDVFLARHPVTQTEVAIKRLKLDLVRDPQCVHRFLVEARHMYHLNHPNILRIMEVLDPPAGPHYVMPYMPPGSLAGMLRPVQPADYVATVRVARDVASALAYAHGKGIIHRDLKPGNVLMDGDGHGQLSDFGLVRTVFNDSLTDVRQSQILGTAAYMSPAVARGEAEDTRCDIYGFGAMLYELLSGRPPYTGRSSPEVIAQVLAGPPKPMLKHNPHASAGLVQIAEGCMARELRDRYAKMTDVLEDLDRVEKGAPPLGPHGMPTQRRNNRMLPVAVVILLLVVLSAIGAWLKYRDKTRPTGNGMMHQPVPGAAPTQPAHGDAPIIAAMAFHNDASGHRVWDILSLIDPARDVMSGEWSRQGGILTVKPANSYLVVRIPLLPPDEYDFRVGFLLGQQSAGMLALASHRGRFDFMIGKDGICGVERVDGLSARDRLNPTIIKKPPLALNVRHECVIHIRRQFIAVDLDGESIISRRTDYSELTEQPNVARHDDAVGLASWSGGVDFDTAELVEITGMATPVPLKR